MTPQHIRIDLEGFDPPITYVIDPAGNRVSLPRFSLSKGEAEKLHIIAEASKQDIEWTVELLTIVNGKRKILTIDDEGRPFRTCGTEGLPTHGWYFNEWQPPLPS
jgi:hypothetical protein